MEAITENAYAKLNISLDVTERRPDGYHNMCMVMQTISLADELTIRFTDTGHVTARASLSYLPCDKRNLAVAGAIRFLGEIGETGQGLALTLKKNIPVGAGMAGGSADGAAVLRALNRAYGYPVKTARLLELAAELGSDVPFCLLGGTALASGRGEILEPLPDLPDCKFVVSKPGFSVSTPELFRKLDSCSLRCHPDTQGILQALEKGDLEALARRMYNVFEDVDDRRMRTVREIKGQLLDCGALSALMTGTGSAVFGVFRPEADTRPAIQRLKKTTGFCVEATAVGRQARK